MRCSAAVLLSIKLIFIICYTAINIIESFNDFSRKTLIISRLVLMLINLPSNIILCIGLCYFYKMGLRFLDYYSIGVPNFNQMSIKFWMTNMLIISVLQLMINGTYHVYPIIMYMLDLNCFSWYRQYY